MNPDVIVDMGDMADVARVSREHQREVAALWGIADRRLSRGVRVQLWLVPLAYAAIYVAMAAIAHHPS